MAIVVLFAAYLEFLLSELNRQAGKKEFFPLVCPGYIILAFSIEGQRRAPAYGTLVRMSTLVALVPFFLYSIS